MRQKRYFSFLFLLIVCSGLSACKEVRSSISDLRPTLELSTSTAMPLATVLPPPTAAPSPSAAPQPTATPAITVCSQPDGEIQHHKISFPQRAYPYVFRVYLPPCFDRSAAVRYPVLYMIHGQSYNDDQWDRLGIDETADELITAGKIPPFLIVMPLERNTFSEPLDISFGDILIKDVVPWIDNYYPTCTDRACRAIGGLSRGGAWALRLGFKNWELFSAISLHSTPPFISDPNQFPYWLQEIPQESLPVVYMDLGQRDPYKASNIEFEQLLVQYNVPHEWYIFNGTHDEAYWSEHVADYLAWYGSRWKLIPENLLH